MITKQLYDKSSWMKGPWLDEPDIATWIDSDTFYSCVIFRNMLGAFCGYVGVDFTHPLYDVDLNAEEFKYIDVHGGVHFTDWVRAHDLYFYPATRRWWIGFDCMQDTDLCPATAEGKRPRGRPRVKPKADDPGPHYRDFEYVQTQVDFLNAQLSMFDPRFY